MSQEDIRSRVGYQVKRVQQRLRQVCDEELRGRGVSMAQYAVLRALADEPGLTSAELARRCFVTRQSLGDVLAGLTSGGLVEVTESVRSGRSRPVVLTPEGVALLAGADQAVRGVEERMTSGLDDADRHALVRLLERCAENLE